MGILRVMPVIVTIACILVGAMALDASARMEARWALQTGDIIVGEDISVQKPMAAIFHQQTAFASDIENLQIDFPITADGLGLGPTSGTTAIDNDIGLSTRGTSNILPFGPVNLAFPNVHQDVTQELETTDTGFFIANWAFMADTATGNLGTEPIGTYLGSGHPFKNPKMLGSEFVWPYMTPIAKAADGSLALDMNSLSPVMDPYVKSLSTDVSIINRDTVNITRHATPRTNVTNTTSAGNVTGATNATNTSSATAKMREGWGKKKPPVADPKWNKTQIGNSTNLQRMYRNAFIGTTMHNAYEGKTSYPEWITPYRNGTGCFNPSDTNTMLSLARNKTVAGAHIAPVFWDL